MNKKEVEMKIEDVKGKAKRFIKNHSKDIGVLLIGAGAGLIAQEKLKKWNTTQTVKMNYRTIEDGIIIQGLEERKIGKPRLVFNALYSLEDGMEIGSEIYDACLKTKRVINGGGRANG